MRKLYPLDGAGGLSTIALSFPAIRWPCRLLDAEIYEHVLAIAPRFGLRVSRLPPGQICPPAAMPCRAVRRRGRRSPGACRRPRTRASVKQSNRQAREGLSYAVCYRVVAALRPLRYYWTGIQAIHRSRRTSTPTVSHSPHAARRSSRRGRQHRGGYWNSRTV